MNFAIKILEARASEIITIERSERCSIGGHSFGKKKSISTKITFETIFMGPN